MNILPVNKAALIQRGVAALRKGDAAGAKDAFEQVSMAGEADATTHVGMAFACRSLGDTGGAMAAVDRALALEPRNLQALIVKADFLGDSGDARAAAAFYRTAVRAAAPVEKLPPDLRSEIARAARMCDRYSAQFETSLGAQLAARGLRDTASSGRFRQSLDLLFGKKQIFFQQPRYYFFPGLPQIQFYDRALFPWLDQVEAATAGIRAELVEVLKEEAAFKPYVETEPNRPRNEQDGMLNNPDWSAFYLWKNGERVAENAARCPKTMRALEHIPLTHTQNRSPSVLFSLLRAGAHIPPHNGMVNTRLIGHLPLIVPGECSFRVGNETREWVEGKAWIFDDTMQHEAWNRSSRDRVILLFEIWRPELLEEERRLVNAMFESIDAHTGEKPAWEI